jgi:hypothetical protein
MFLVMFSIYVSNVVQFFNAVCQTLYVIGCNVTLITGPEAPFRVYVSAKMLKHYQDPFIESSLNLFTAALTDIPNVLRAVYQQGITCDLSYKASILVHSSSATAAGKYRTIRFVVLESKCNALVLGSLPKRSRHPVCTSSDIGVGRHRYSRPYTALDNKLNTRNREKRI